jgi:hypothetical protein
MLPKIQKRGVTASVDRITRMTRKSAKRLRRYIQFKGVYGVWRTRAHVDEVMQGRWGLAAAALEHQQQHKRATPRAAPPTECRSTRAAAAAAGAGLNSLRTRPVLPQTSRYYLAESESLATPSSLSAVLLPPPHGHGVLANRATPCPAYLYRRRLRVCANPPPPPPADAKAPNRSP